MQNSRKNCQCSYNHVQKHYNQGHITWRLNWLVQNSVWSCTGRHFSTPWKTIEDNEDLGFVLVKRRSRRYPPQRITDTDFEDDIATFPDTLQNITLLIYNAYYRKSSKRSNVFLLTKLVGRLVGQSVRLSAHWSVGWSIGQSISRSIGPSIGMYALFIRNTFITNPRLNLTKN